MEYSYGLLFGNVSIKHRSGILHMIVICQYISLYCVSLQLCSLFCIMLLKYQQMKCLCSHFNRFVTVVKSLRICMFSFVVKSSCAIITSATEIMSCKCCVIDLLLLCYDRDILLQYQLTGKDTLQYVSSFYEHSIIIKKSCLIRNSYC